MLGEKPSRYASKSAPEPLLLADKGQVTEQEGGGVIEGLAGGLAKGGLLIGDTRRVQTLLRGAHLVLRRFQHCVESADDRHGQDDVAVLAPDVNVAQNVVRDAPYEAADV